MVPTPIEIVSKVILRHANLPTTQRYLGKVSDMEAMRWVENLYGGSNKKDGVKTQNTSPLPIIYFRDKKARGQAVFE